MKIVASYKDTDVSALVSSDFEKRLAQPIPEGWRIKVKERYGEYEATLDQCPAPTIEEVEA